MVARPMDRLGNRLMVLDIPTGEAGLTPEWLGAALGTPIASVTTTRIGEDEGFTGGRLYRLTIPGRDSLVAKLSPTDPALRAQFAKANAREVTFYTELSAGLPVPGCAYAACDAATGASILLLQDMGSARAVAFREGAGVHDVTAMLRTFARIHAAWWNAPALAELSGAAVLSEFSFATPWAHYTDALADLLPDVVLPQGFIALGDFAATHLAEIYDHLQERGPLTVLHRDPQLDNILFDADGQALLLDWQILGKGRGVWDVAYFLISSVPPALRRIHERAWVRGYHAELVALGGTGYDFDRCWRDYLASVMGKLFVTVWATVELDNSTAHKRAWRRTDLMRLLAFVEDHDLTPSIWDFSDD